MKLFFNEEENRKFLNGEPIYREFLHFSEDDCPGLEALLAGLLRSISLEFLLEIIFTILNELLVNAFKANSKRVFFKQIGKDINKPETYNQGLLEFREEFGNFKKELLTSLEKTEYRIRLKIMNDDSSLKFWVSNNAEILEEERSRIDFRIHSSIEAKNLTDAYYDVLDTYESSGLGIILVKLLLKNSGIHDNNFKIESSPTETVAYFEIPKSIIPLKTKLLIAETIQNGVVGIPAFPKSITKIIQTIHKKGSTFPEIAKSIEGDPSISVEILKLANSPLFTGSGSISSLIDGIRRIGISNIERILYVIGTKRIFDTKNTKIEEMWKHAYKTAFYSFHLAKSRKPHSKQEVSSLGGLLHDLGRMVLATLEEPIIEILNQLRKDSQMNNSEYLEEISLGTNHTEIGLLLADKWNFPDDIKEIILYHHRPWLAKEENQPECETVYIADFMANFHRRSINYAILDPKILEKFGFTSLREIQEYEQVLKEKFDKENRIQ
jgi:putative nucleotidyltransferase with HDIG domain